MKSASEVRRSFRVTLILVAAFCGATMAAAQDAVTVTTNYYLVSGNNGRDLSRSIARLRPWKDSRQTHGYTEWKIHWTFNLTASGPNCRIHSLNTRTTITITLPKWNATAETPKPLMEKWEKYMEALRTHEEGHKQFALAAAKEIRRRILALKAEPTCEALSASINQTAKTVLDEYRRKEAEYDTKTDHGATQGARFP